MNPEYQWIDICVGKVRVVRKEGSGLWVCECECGRFILRRTQALKHAKRRGSPTRCGWCTEVAKHGLAAEEVAELERERKL